MRQNEIDARMAAQPYTVEQAAQALKGAIANPVLLETRVVKVTNMPAQFFILSGVLQNLDVTIHQTVANIFVFRRDYILQVACTVATNDATTTDDLWPAWRPTVMSILSTMTVED